MSAAQHRPPATTRANAPTSGGSRGGVARGAGVRSPPRRVARRGSSRTVVREGGSDAARGTHTHQRWFATSPPLALFQLPACCSGGNDPGRKRETGMRPAAVTGGRRDPTPRASGGGQLPGGGNQETPTGTGGQAPIGAIGGFIVATPGEAG